MKATPLHPLLPLPWLLLPLILALLCTLVDLCPLPGNDYLAAESTGVWAITLVVLPCSFTEQSNLTSLDFRNNKIGKGDAARLAARLASLSNFKY